jgi:hypothetical protein
LVQTHGKTDEKSIRRSVQKIRARFFLNAQITRTSALSVTEELGQKLFFANYSPFPCLVYKEKNRKKPTTFSSLK